MKVYRKKSLVSSFRVYIFALFLLLIISCISEIKIELQIQNEQSILNENFFIYTKFQEFNDGLSNCSLGIELLRNHQKTKGLLLIENGELECLKVKKEILEHFKIMNDDIRDLLSLDIDLRESRSEAIGIYLFIQENSDHLSLSELKQKESKLNEILTKVNGLQNIVTLKEKVFRHKLHLKIEENQHKLSQMTNLMLTIKIIIVLLFVIIILFFKEYFSKFFTNTLHQFLNAIKSVSQGNLNTNVDSLGYIELEDISTSFNQMGKKLSDYQNQLISKTNDLERSIQKLNEATQAKNKFLSTMSHELRTPMNGIIGMTEILLHAKNDQERHEIIDTLKRSETQLLNIINDLLSIVEMDSEKVKINHSSLNLYVLMDEKMAPFREEARKKNLEFNYQIDPNIPSQVLGDENKLGKIFSCLMSNALKFTSQGHITVTIKLLSIKYGKAKLLFSIQDSGIGISKDNISKIFETFYQADMSMTRSFGGTGLGLSICNFLIKSLGGEIEVESNENEGSLFKFFLSFQLPQNELQQNIQAVDSRVSNINLTHNHLLLVDDNLTNLKLLEKILTQKGFQISKAENGIDAVNLCKEKKFSLIFMDLQMPICNGWDASKKIRELNDFYSKVPIIAVTANTTKEDILKCNDAGINKVSTKPVDIKIITHYLEKYNLL